MTAYAMVELTVHNREQMGEYLEKVGATIAAHNERYLIRGEASAILEGSAGQHPLKVLLEFPDLATARQWYDSPDYQAIIGNRLANSTANFLLIEGV